MYSKLLVRLTVAAVTVWVLTYCGIHLGEKSTGHEPISYNGKGYGCVGQIPEHIESYIADQLSEDDVTQFVRCLQHSFTSFAQYTRGRDQSTYAPDEIRRFLENYFIKDRKISDQLLYEFMVIKQALVGGDSEHIARPELFDAVEMLEDIRLEALRLKPHLKYLNPRLAKEQNPQDIGLHLSEANAALNQSIQVLAGRLAKSKKVYPLGNLASFMSEFRSFVRWDQHFSNAHPVEDWISLLRVFKEITVSPNEPDIIHEADWTPMLQSMSGWYLAYLQYEVGIKKQPITYGYGLQNTMLLADETLSMTRAALRTQPNKTISFDQINRLMASLHAVGWIPEKIRAASLEQAVYALVTRVAGDTSVKPSERRAEGLDLQALANIEGEFYRWAYVQLKLDSSYRQGIPDSVNNAVPNLQAHILGISPLIRAKIRSIKNSDWDEFIKIKSLMRPLFPENVDRVELVPDSNLSQYGLENGFYNLSMMNVLRSAVGLMFRGYSESSSGRSSWTAGIQSPELQQFYVDIRNLGIDLGWIDKRNLNSGSRAFVEGKLFTSSSTGLNYDPNQTLSGEMSFVETMEYLAYLYSGGEMANDIFAKLSDVCAIGPLDINGRPKVSRLCAQGQMPAAIGQFMTNMPYLLNYMARATPDVRQNFAQVLLDTSFSPDNSDSNWLEKNELSTLAVVAHYAESVMTRFDRNQDGVLTNDELEQAVPIFRGLIKKIAKEKFGASLSDKEAHGAFFYILDYKAVPSSLMDFAYIWKNEWWAPNLALDRLQLAQVFKAIIAKLFEMGKVGPAFAPPPSSMLSNPQLAVAK